MKKQFVIISLIIAAGFIAKAQNTAKAWDNFLYPKIIFTNHALETNGKFYDEIIPNPVEFIQQTAKEVCQLMYKNAGEIVVVNDITYDIKDIEGCSAKGGGNGSCNIFFSSKYLESIRPKKTDKECLDEIKGVLIHELVHCYQHNPKGCGSYGTNKQFTSLIEGLADAIRIKAGYKDISMREKGGSYLDGYGKSAFFIKYLEKYDADIMYKLNKSAFDLDSWSWNNAINHILNKDVDALWKEYQESI